MRKVHCAAKTNQVREGGTLASVLQIKAEFGPRKIPGGSMADCNAYFQFCLSLIFQITT